jgi:FKBP-type peptidyl-prolyl cis-trans isomerase SlyD
MSNETIKDGMVVKLAYTLEVEGEVLEEATVDDALDYLHGAENIVPGLEYALNGKRVGDKLDITLQPADAYGEYDEDDMELIEKDDMPDEIEVGMELLLEDKDGNFFEATIREIRNDGVLLDFNYPLAGKVVTYHVEVLSIRPANKEELEHGHPHSEDYIHE